MDQSKSASPRVCARCGRSLSRYNDDDYCGGCAKISGRDRGGHADDADVAKIGGRLRAARLRRGMTQEVLAGLAGLSSAYVSMVENGQRRLDRYSLILAFADALGVPPGELAPGIAVKRNRLAARRKAVGFSQEQLAESLRIDRSTVGRWESGETEPQLWLRPKLAMALQVSVDQLNDLLAQANPKPTPRVSQQAELVVIDESKARSVRTEQVRLSQAMRESGCSWRQVADEFVGRWGLTYLQAFRLVHGLSQRQAAERYNSEWHPAKPLTGKHISYWEMWPSESGKQPPLNKLGMLAKVYECSVADLLAERTPDAGVPRTTQFDVVAPSPVPALPLPSLAPDPDLYERIARAAEDGRVVDDAVVNWLTRCLAEHRLIEDEIGAEPWPTSCGRSYRLLSGWRVRRGVLILTHSSTWQLSTRSSWPGCVMIQAIRRRR